MATYTNLAKAIGGDSPVIFPTYTVATLPAASADLSGAVVYCSDALNASETTGNGTGNLALCNSDATPAWVRVDTGAAIGA